MYELNILTARLADPNFYLTDEFTALLGYLRKESPVHWCQTWPQRGFWAVTTYKDIKAVYERPLIFSNEAAGNIIPADINFHSGDREAMGFGSMMANVDPPRHTDLRRVFSRFFSGPSVAKLEGLCQEIVDEILDEVRSREQLDFVTDVAGHLPARLMCRLFGVPREDWAYITRLANSLGSFTDPDLQLGDSPAETFRNALTSIFAYVSDLVEKRRVDPRDDLCTAAALAEVNGEPLPHRDAAWNCWAVLAAGFETTRNVIVGGLIALLEHPDQAALLRAEPKLIQSAVDEMIRWTAPATANLRVAMEDSMIGSQQVAKGDWVVLYIDSANRDESVFVDPFRFDIRRRPNPYLSFGYGIHNCIGRMLAMLEVKVMIRSVLDQVAEIEFVDTLEFSASSIAKGVKKMPVRMHWKPNYRQRTAAASATEKREDV